ncbi:MAG: hypothetical protein R3B07_04400 [Polyangiaceae bacterium]
MKKLTWLTIGLALFGLNCSSDDDGGGSGGTAGTAGSAGSSGSGAGGSGAGGSGGTITTGGSSGATTGGTSGSGGTAGNGGVGGTAGTSGSAGTASGGTSGSAGTTGGSAGTSGGAGGSAGATGGSAGTSGSAGTGGSGGASGTGGSSGAASCQPNEYGPNCTPCTCVNGACDDGITGTGACSCQTGWDATNCDVCAADYYGSSCQACGCGFGTCDDGLTGNGDCCVDVGAGAVFNDAMTAPSSAYIAEWDVTPGTGGNSDVVIGLSEGTVPGSGYSSMAVLIRFNSSGNVDARKGSSYTADASFAYTPGKRYHVRATVDSTAKTYTVGVTEEGGSEVVVATDYGFRTEQANATPNNWAVLNQTSRPSTEVCNFTVH